MSTFQERLKDYRINIAKLTQKEASELLRMPQSSYNRYENGEYIFNYDTLMDLKNALHIPSKHFSYIIQGNEEEKINDMVLREKYEDAELELIMEKIKSIPELKKLLSEVRILPDGRIVNFVESINPFLKEYKKLR